MKKSYLFYACIVFLCLVGMKIQAQNGRVVTETIKSDILKRDMTCSIYLPPSYENSSRNYPTLYLLHGMGDNHEAWVNRGEVSFITNRAIQSGKTPEMLIVMPDGLVDAFYLNNFDKSILWEDFFYQEFIPMIEKKYRVIPQRTYRAIAGLSMGGYGSVLHALKHRDLFSTCYAMSGAFLEIKPIEPGSKSTEMFENVYVKLWGPRNDKGLPQNYKAYSLHDMVREMPEYKAPVGWQNMSQAIPKLFIECGDDDFLLRANTNLVHLLKEKKIPVEFRVRDGVHNWTYWRKGLEDALEYIGADFRN